MSEAFTIYSIVEQLKQRAAIRRHRHLLVLAGTENWCYQLARDIIEYLGSDSALWVGGEPHHTVKTIQPNQAKQWLGRETDLVIINAWAGFDVDAFGALSGTVRAGGLLVLLTPDLPSWHLFNDPENKRVAVYPDDPEGLPGRYLNRLSKLITGSKDLLYISEGGHCSIQLSHATPPISSNTEIDGAAWTEGQAAAISAIKKVVHGHRRRPLVLTADRGRGKSAALGIAAASLLREGLSRIIVTAPALVSADVVFKHAAEQLDCELVKKGAISWQGREIVFKAPDELSQSNEQCDLLLVDEAAAIPASLLQQLLSSYSRIVFSSTIHGYEGTGRGFAVRFRKTLDCQTPQWRKLHINEPIRWAEGDPLEAFSYKALMLKATPVDGDKLTEINWQQADFEKINRDELINNESLLSELFGLLVLAHYKTRPFDLRHLLDGSNIDIYALRADGHILATALVAREGGIAPDLAEGIWLGKRRVRGHLLPQSLSNHLGIKNAITLRGARILRIAVHPDIQQQGLGLSLLEKITSSVKQQGLDYLGSMFGATTDLLDFWQKSGFQPVRMGLTREASSGTYSTMVIKPLTQSGKVLAREARQRFEDQLLWLLVDGLQCLDSEIVMRLLHEFTVTKAYELSVSDWQDIESFALGLRLYESCIAAIKKLALFALCYQPLRDRLDKEQRQLLIYKVLQNRSWQETARLQGLPGKNQVMGGLRKYFQTILEYHKVSL